MRRFFNYIKSHWLVIMVGATLIMLAFNALMIRSPGYTPTPTSSPSDKVASYDSITPGRSSEDELREKLGTPIKTQPSENKTISQFKATTGLRTHTAITENGRLVFFKEIVTTKDKKTVTDIKNLYGQASHVLYEPYPHSTFNLFVYPANGIAYLGHKDGGLLEIWYFTPTTFQSFKETWARDFLINPAEETSQ